MQLVVDSCVHNGKGIEADWSVMWDGPLPFGFRLEEGAGNGMLRNQKAGAT